MCRDGDDNDDGCYAKFFYTVEIDDKFYLRFSKSFLNEIDDWYAVDTKSKDFLVDFTITDSKGMVSAEYSTTLNLFFSADDLDDPEASINSLEFN